MERIEHEKQQLLEAWDDLIESLQNAREVIDSPDLYAPAPTSRILAEGYRYLVGFVHHAIERSFHEDTDFPAIRNALSIYNKSTIDNPDAIYFYAAIDGRKSYVIKGQLEDFRHWRGESKSIEGATAPQYVIFEVTDGPLPGDTGELSELAPGYRTGFGTLDSTNLKVDEDGELSLILAPQKPDGYTGNYICTRKPKSKDAADGVDCYASYISGRQLFYDWENEAPVALSITCLETEGDHPPALTVEKAAANLRRLGSIVNGQMRFWMEMYDKVLNANGTYEPTANAYFMPINGYNAPNSASAATGGGMSTNIYAGGIYDLGEDEALYVEATFTGEPNYVSAHLGNLWGESPDYANHQSSLTLDQMHMGEDGIQRWIISHRDPGVKNWLDTTGIPKGYVTHRWAYTRKPQEKDWPSISAKVISLNDVHDYFPEGTPNLSSAERASDIAIRQRHVQRRYRVF